MKTKRAKRPCSATWLDPEAAAGNIAAIKTCPNDARARGLCWGHYQQRRRQLPYGPLDRPATHEQLPPVRVPKALAEQLRVEAELRGISLYAFIAELLTDWYNNRRK